MKLYDQDLQELLSLAKAQGFLTYDQVNDYLPDEAASSQKLDQLLMSLDLVTIRIDVPLEPGFDGIGPPQPDPNELMALFHRLDFQSLANKVAAGPWFDWKQRRAEAGALTYINKHRSP